jgi:hypothetical protein
MNTSQATAPAASSSKRTKARKRPAPKRFFLLLVRLRRAIFLLSTLHFHFKR